MVTKMMITMVTAQWVTARQDMTTTTMATDDDNDNDGDSETGDKIDNDGYGAMCANNDDDNGTNMATVRGEGLVG